MRESQGRRNLPKTQGMEEGNCPAHEIFTLLVLIYYTNFVKEEGGETTHTHRERGGREKEREEEREGKRERKREREQVQGYIEDV